MATQSEIITGAIAALRAARATFDTRVAQHEAARAAMLEAKAALAQAQADLDAAVESVKTGVLP